MSTYIGGERCKPGNHVPADTVGLCCHNCGLDAELLPDLNDDELMCLVNVLNERLDEGLLFEEHTLTVPSNAPVRFQADMRVVVGKLLTTARERGIVNAPACWTKKL